MRIVLLDDSFLHYTGQLARGLAEAGHDVLLIAESRAIGFVSTDLEEGHKRFAEIVGERVRLAWLDTPPDSGLRSLPANLRSMAHIISLIRKHRPEVIHMQETVNYRMCTAVALSLRRYPVVLTIHNAERHPGKKREKTEFIRPWLRRHNDGIIVHGEDIKQRLLKVSSVNEDAISMLPIGAYTYYRRWLSGSSADSRNVLFFGSVFEYKGLDYLVRAAPAICEAVTDAKIVIAGTGPDWPRCKSFIHDPSKFVLMDRRIDEPEVAGLFESAAVVVLPYVEASQSAVLLVAIALGKPVVITDVGSMPDMVEEGQTGLIVPPRDEKALAQAIVRLLQDRELRDRMSAKALQRATSGDLSWNSIAANTTGIYDLAIRTHRKG